MMNMPGYERLADVLQRAYDQAAKGKGRERHAQGEPFHEQVMQDGARRFGVGGLLFQAYKKSEESQRLPHDKAVAELLGAINYLAGAVIALERTDTTSAAESVPAPDPHGPDTGHAPNWTDVADAQAFRFLNARAQEFRRVGSSAVVYVEDGPFLRAYNGDTLAMAVAHAIAGSAPQDLNSDNWIPWFGGPIPVTAATPVRVRFRGSDDTTTHRGPAMAFRWAHRHVDSDIVAYMVVREAAGG